MGIINILNNLLLATNWPEGFWQNLISIVFDFVGDYGLTIIVFTVLLKIVMIPLDFMQRKSTKHNTEKQAKLQPHIQKLNKKYANNKEMLNQKTMELYKKENYNIVGSCLGMLVSVVITLVVFITLFGAMNNIAQFKIADQYDQLATTYNQEIVIGTEETAEAAVSVKYGEIKESFLWIENIWRPDRNASIIPSYTEYVKLTNSTVEDGGPTEVEYNQVMGALTVEYDGWNGLFILILGSALVTFFSQKVMQNFTKPAKKEENNSVDENAMPQPNTKLMLYLLPGLMILFTWSYSAAFALYIVTNSVMTMLVSILSYKIIDKMDKDNEEKNKIKIEYSR